MRCCAPCDPLTSVQFDLDNCGVRCIDRLVHELVVCTVLHCGESSILPTAMHDRHMPHCICPPGDQPSS
jgi:hypothetical protein